MLLWGAHYHSFLPHQQLVCFIQGVSVYIYFPWHLAELFIWNAWCLSAFHHAFLGHLSWAKVHCSCIKKLLFLCDVCFAATGLPHSLCYRLTCLTLGAVMGDDPINTCSELIYDSDPLHYEPIATTGLRTTLRPFLSLNSDFPERLIEWRSNARCYVRWYASGKIPLLSWFATWPLVLECGGHSCCICRVQRNVYLPSFTHTYTLGGLLYCV